MMLVNPSMKEKYPMWYEAMEKQQKQQEIDNMLLMAKLEFTQYVDAKMKEVNEIIRDIENRVSQSSYNIETTFNSMPIENGNINREIKKMVVNEIRKALK